jgi:hypothetical protein
VPISDLLNLIIRAVDCRAITPSQEPEVVQEWRERTLLPKDRRYCPCAERALCYEADFGLEDSPDPRSNRVNERELPRPPPAPPPDRRPGTLGSEKQFI